jgi:hypothetical protein
MYLPCPVRCVRALVGLTTPIAEVERMEMLAIAAAYNAGRNGMNAMGGANSLTSIEGCILLRGST